MYTGPSRIGLATGEGRQCIGSPSRATTKRRLRVSKLSLPALQFPLYSGVHKVRSIFALLNTYQEVTPGGDGVRIWGFAEGNLLSRKFTLEIDGKQIAAELFRRTNKALTITGYRLNTVQQLVNIDKVFDWAIAVPF
jgi:hypothetical protein